MSNIILFAQTLAKSIHNLWQTRENLHFSRLRLSTLPVILALPLAIIICDMQYGFFFVPVRLLGLESATLMYSAYCFGALFMFFVPKRFINTFLHISLAVMVLSFPFLMLSAQYIRLVAGIIAFLGVGGIAICVTMLYTSLLNNTERLFGILFIVLSSPVLSFAHESGLVMPVPFGIVMSIIAVSLAVSVWFIKKEIVEHSCSMDANAYPFINIGYSLIYIVVYFVIMNFQTPILVERKYAGEPLFLTGGLSAVALSVVIMLILKRSVWHMWNIYIVAIFTGMIFLGFVPSLQGVSQFLLGFGNGIGYIYAYYMGMGVLKRYYSYSNFKKTLIVFMGLTLLSILISGGIAAIFPKDTVLILIIIAGLSFIILNLLSPAVYKNVFSGDWLGDFEKADMSPGGDPFYSFGFTGREKEVCRLLLEGYTLRQISSMIGLSYATVNTYYVNVYRKLGINSKAELMLLFKNELKK